ncbi:hypothetical protein [Streptomyces sp. NPDC002537]
MPRPTPAQIAYGSATVVFSTLAMLLLSQARTGPGIAVIALVSLTLGLLVAVTVPLPRQALRARVRRYRPTSGDRVPEQRAPLSADTRISEHSLHG